MTEVALVDRGSALVLADDQSYWNQHQLAALTQLGVDRATPADLGVFMHVCQRTGLDPFARQIYLVRRDGKQVIQTGIDGYRLIARRSVDRAREKLSISAPEWCDAEGKWHEVWIAEGYPSAARVIVYRDGEAFPAIALWREYVQMTTDNGQRRVTRMWDTRPAGQLAKCAEALALRKAFPQDLSGIYVDEEMQAASGGGVVQGEAVQSGGLGAALAAQETAEQGPSGPGEDQEIRGDAPDPADQGVVGDQPGPESSVPMVTEAQLKNIGRLMGKTGLNITDRDEALVKVAVIIGREIQTRKDLTRDEASKVIDSIAADLDSREK